MSALNKPSYDIELGTGKKKELSDKVIEMVKSSPDVVDDLDLQSSLTGRLRDISGLIIL